MAYSAEVLTDTITPLGARCTTMEVVFPRNVLAEFNTHRVLSRNSESSRAVPPEKRISIVASEPFIPDFGGRVKGMGEGELHPDLKVQAEHTWQAAARDAAYHANVLNDLGVAKVHVNRLLEPFLWHRVLVTATEWDNYLALRCHEDAQREIREVSILMRSALAESRPKRLSYNEWHLPLVSPEEVSESIWNGRFFWQMVSAGRCARISYLTHGVIEEPTVSYDRATRLLNAGHMSPFEHQAKPAVNYNMAACGNLQGYKQYRKFIPNESVFRGKRV